MIVAERRLHRMQLAVPGEPSMVVTSAPSAWTANMVQDFSAAVDMDDAGAALAGVAADMRAGQPQMSRRKWTSSVGPRRRPKPPCRYRQFDSRHADTSRDDF